MKFVTPLIEGTLIKRYKRFLADIRMDDGSVITAHCPNSGSMKSCAEPGFRVALSRSDNPRRRYPYTWEMVHNGSCWIRINTMLPNRIVQEAMESNRISELKGYGKIRREVRYGENSRIDLLLSADHIPPCFVEIKNVTLVEDDGDYYFPDAVTARGLKHLGELMAETEKGNRAVMFFLVQRDDGRKFKPAEHIDPDYATALVSARRTGVEILIYRADVSPSEISVAGPVEADF